MEIVSPGMPVGAMILWGGPIETIPSQWAIAGTSLRKDLYGEAFRIFGTLYGSTETHFNLPNPNGLGLRVAGAQTLSGKNYTASLGEKRNDAIAQTNVSVRMRDGGQISISNDYGTDSRASRFVTSIDGSTTLRSTMGNGAVAATVGSGTETHGADMAFYLIIKVL